MISTAPTRLAGAAQATWGVAEIATAAAADVSSGGWAALVTTWAGIDGVQNMVADTQTFATGEYTSTLTGTLARASVAAAGGGPRAQALAEAGVGLVGTAGAAMAMARGARFAGAASAPGYFHGQKVFNLQELAGKAAKGGGKGAGRQSLQGQEPR